jgi:hypothetical protein
MDLTKLLKTELFEKCEALGIKIYKSKNKSLFNSRLNYYGNGTRSREHANRIINFLFKFEQKYAY